MTLEVHTTRRVFFGQLGGLAMGAGLAASCRDEPKPEALHEQVALHAKRRRTSTPLRVIYPAGCLANLQPVVAAFQTLTGVDVALSEVSLDSISAEVLVASRLGGRTTAFDVAIPATFGIPDLVEGGALAPLDDLAAEFAPPGLTAHSLYTLGDRYRGRLYGYQADGDAYVMFYNRRWLEDPDSRRRYADRYGTALAVPQTWSELDRQLAFFHAPQRGRYGGTLYRSLGYIGWEFWARLHATGLFPVDDELHPRFARPEVIDALQDMVATNAWMHPTTRTDGLFDNFASFAAGDKYANIGWGGTQKYLRGPKSKVRGALAFGLLPGGVFAGKAEPIPCFNWGWNYVVSSGSKQRELAYLFALFASTPQVSTLSVREREGYFDPFRTEHYADAAITDTYGASFLEVHRESMRRCVPDLYLRGRGSYFAALQHAVFAVSEGRLTASDAMRRLVAKWEALTDRLGRRVQAEQWRYLKASYPASLAAHLR